MQMIHFASSTRNVSQVSQDFVTYQSNVSQNLVISARNGFIENVRILFNFFLLFFYRRATCLAGNMTDLLTADFLNYTDSEEMTVKIIADQLIQQKSFGGMPISCSATNIQS